MILPFGEDTSLHRRSTPLLRCWRRSEGRGEWPDIPVDPPKRSGRLRPTLRCALARQTSTFSRRRCDHLVLACTVRRWETGEGGAAGTAGDAGKSDLVGEGGTHASPSQETPQEFFNRTGQRRQD
eukprot:scaffold72653_cov35-Phaeocystis_antarctica.AAC.1